MAHSPCCLSQKKSDPLDLASIQLKNEDEKQQDELPQSPLFPSVQQLLALFQCAVCYNLCTPELRQCRNGHLTCNGCLARLASESTCPVCRAPGGHTGGSRNLAGERILLMLNPAVPCDQGCEITVRLSEMALHDGVCANRPYNCPEVLCPARLPAPQLKAHFLQNHTYQVVKGSQALTNFGLKSCCHGYAVGRDNQWMTKVFVCFGTVFFACVLTVKSELYVWLWHLGEEGAQRFRSKICLFGQGGRRMVYDGAVSSLRAKAPEVVKEGRCLRVDAQSVNEFQENGKLWYKIEVMDMNECAKINV